MDRSELVERIDELEKVINSTKVQLDITDSKDDRDLLNEQIEEYTKELNKLKESLNEEKEYSPEELLKEIVRLNPSVEIRYQKAHPEVIACSKKGDELKLPKGYEYNDKNGITNKHHTSSGRYTSILIGDVKNADVIVVNKDNKKKEDKKQAKKDKKVSKETKTEKKEKGSFGEVVSCLFGQVDKRVNNLVFKSESFYNWAKQKRMKRYDQLGQYSFPRILISAALMATAIPLGGFGVLPTIGLVYGAFVGVRTVGDLVRKAMNKPPVIVRKKEITNGSYFENIKNAWNKFTNSKEVTKTKEAKAAANPTEAKGSEDTKDKVNVESLINTFNKVFGELDLDNIDLSKYDYCHSIYKTIENKGALDKLSKETKEKYAQYEKKVNEYKTLSSAFVKNVNELDVDNLDKEALDRCQYIYNTLKDKFGEEVLKNIPSEVVNKFNEYEKTLTNKKEPKVVEIDKLKLTKLISYIMGFKLEATTQSVDECEKLIQQVFNLNEKERKVLRGNEEAWNKFKYLMKKTKEYCEEFKGLKNNDRVSTFINLVNTFDFKADEVKYDRNQLMACMNIYSRLSNDEKALIPESVMRVYNDALRFDQVFTLKTKLSMLDIDKCIRQNDYSDIYECCEIYDRYISNERKGLSLEVGNDLMHKRKLGRDEINEFPQGLRDKLKKAMDEREKVQKYQNATIGIKNVVVNGRVQSVLRIVNNNEVLDDLIIPWSSATFNENEITNAIVNRHPYMSNIRFVSYEEVENLISDMEEKSKGNHR